MEQNFTKTAVDTLLKKIIASEEFNTSPTNKGLLKYIVNARLENKTPKEMDLAIDYFHKKPPFNTSEDSTVRSHVYTLRKKLEKYYLTEGKDDRLKIEIPKGTYQCEIILNASRTTVNRWKTIGVVTAFILAISWAAILYLLEKPSNIEINLQQNLQVNSDNIFLKDYFESEKQTVIVLGDYFAFVEKNKLTKGDRRVRDGAINSEADLGIYIKEHPEEIGRIDTRRSFYLASIISKTLVNLLPALSAYGKSNITIDVASAVSEESVSDQNVIFIGPYKTMRFFIKYVTSLSYNINFYPHHINIANQDSSNFYRFNSDLPEESFLQRDYAIITKTTDKKGRIIGIIAAFSPSGVISAVRWIMDDSMEKEVSKKFNMDKNQFPINFECLIKIDELDQSDYLSIINFLPHKD